MSNLKNAWRKNLDEGYIGPTVAVPVIDTVDTVLLIHNLGSVIDPIVGISLKLESSQALVDELLTQTKGFLIEKQEMSYRDEKSTFVVLKCSKGVFNNTFLLFAEKLVEDLEESIRPSIALKNFIKHWEEFFHKVKKKKLTDEEITGLYGELSLLNDLIDKYGVSTNVVKWWNGPLKDPGDFLIELPDRKINCEVKTSALSYDRASIHGLKQLQDSELTESFLCLQKVHLQKVREPSSKHTLIDLLETVRSKLATDQYAISAFEELLEMIAVFDDEHITHCRLAIFQDRARQWYVIDKDFPAITSLSVPEAIRQRVENVRYELNLAGLSFTREKFPF